MALIADLVIDIIFARDIGGFMSIMENNCKEEKGSGGEVIMTGGRKRTFGLPGNDRTLLQTVILAKPNKLISTLLDPNHL